MSIDLGLRLPFHPSEIEELLYRELPASPAPFFDEEFDGVLFRFTGSVADGYASSKDHGYDLTHVLGGPLSLPFLVYFGNVAPLSEMIPRVLHVTAEVLNARPEDLLLEKNGSPILIRHAGSVTLTNSDAWTPAYFDALGRTGPKKPLWPGDPGWEPSESNS
jgi:hypothetical protein